MELTRKTLRAGPRATCVEPQASHGLTEAPRSFDGAKQHSGYTLAGCSCCSSFHEGTEVFRVGEEFSRAGTTVFDHHEDVLRVVSCFEPFCMSTKTLDMCVKQQSMFSEAVFVLEQHARHVVAWLKPPCETSKIGQ